MNKEMQDLFDELKQVLVQHSPKWNTLCDIEQYIIDLQHQLEEKDKVIERKNKCLLEIAKEEIKMVNWLKSKGMNFDNESWVNELEELLERGKNGLDN